MDTSLQYIQMCKQAREIQTLWQPVAWDYIVCTLQQAGDDRVEVISGYCTDSGVYGHGIDGGDNCRYASYYTKKGNWLEFKADHIWLPRQDQLQDMGHVSEIHPPFLELERWHTWAADKGNLEYWDSFTSMEQLWLAFVMKEKYDKVWDGSDWVK